MSTDTSCVFCQIVAGIAPASIFYRDEDTVGFMTTGPVNRGHALVIPTDHSVGLDDLSPAEGAAMWDISHRTAGAIRRSGIRCEGVNMFLADGEAAFQEVPHVHMHIFPRFAGDPFGLIANWEFKPDRTALNEAATLIANQF